MKNILIINGPNLNMLGTREPETYGSKTLSDIVNHCENLGTEFGLECTHKQSNSEGEIIDWIHQANENSDAIIINPGAFSHYSYAIFDALNMYKGAVVEVHISNIHKREEFRHHSVISARADAIIVGCGTNGYELALRHIAQMAN